LVERSGQGADRIFELCLRHGQALPDYTRSDAHDVFLVLDGQLRHPDFLRFLARIDTEQLRQLDAHDLLVLQGVSTGTKLPVEFKARAAQLAEAGFLDRNRGAKYVLARKYARAAGLAPDTRPRDAAFSQLLAFIEENRERGASMEQLLTVVPLSRRFH
jgi:ATP-dependent DNA helicase RecG